MHHRINAKQKFPFISKQISVWDMSFRGQADAHFRNELARIDWVLKFQPKENKQ